jgi:hypothetical protein
MGKMGEMGGSTGRAGEQGQGEKEMLTMRHCEEAPEALTKQSSRRDRDAGYPIAWGASHPRNDASTVDR